MENKVKTRHIQLTETVDKKLQRLQGEEKYSASAVVRAAINMMYQIKGYEEIN
jgi:Arc/MetJ-type ribon-helix-helix transcriptional regulator